MGGFCQGNRFRLLDNPEAFARAAQGLDDAGARGTYFTINPVNPDLLARAANRLKGSPKSTTSDQNVSVIRWLPIDIDPKRPSDISATDEELDQARAVAKAITTWLEGEMGFSPGDPEEMVTSIPRSVLYRLPDLPNNAETHDLITRAVAAIAAPASRRTRSTSTSR